MAKITYDDKEALNPQPSVADKNKVTDADMNEIKQVVNENTPAGIISMYAGATAPTGWLICDGTAISRSTYADLFSAIGATYGAGDGSTTFNLPNLKGRVPVGLDSSQAEFGTLGGTGGEKYHLLTVDELPSHQHPFDIIISGTQAGAPNYAINYQYTPNDVLQGGTGFAGGNQGHNNLQPYIVVNYIISY